MSRNFIYGLALAAGLALCAVGSSSAQQGGRLDLGVTKNGGGAVFLGGGVDFTLTGMNNGPAPIAGSSGYTATITDTLPSDLTGISVSAGPGWGPCTVTGQTVSCTYIGPPTIAANQPLPPIHIHATTTQVGEFKNCAHIAVNGTNDRNNENNDSCAPYVVSPPPPPVISGCLSDSKVAVKCNLDGTYSLTLSSSFTGDTITLTSQTAGVTVTPPQQAGGSTTTWVITGATSGQTVVLVANATKTGGGSEPGTDQCCSGEIKIVMPECPKGEVVVEKKVKNETRASNAVINALAFPIKLVCPPSTINTTFNLNNAGSHTEYNVPYGSVCTVTETSLPPPPPNVCEKGFTAQWSTPVVTPASATINAPITAFTVVNELKCVRTDVKDGTVQVEKKVKNDTRATPAVIQALVFPIGLTCGSPSNLNTSFGLHNGDTHTETNVAYGSVCNVTENTSTLPPPPRDVCGEGSVAVWLPPAISVNPTNATVGSTPVSFTVVNELQCQKTGVLVVKKVVDNHAPIPVPSSTVYQVSVSCGAPANINESFGLTDNASHTTGGIAYTSNCSITEVPPPVPNVCPANLTPVWTQHYFTTNTPTINAPITTVTLQNRLDCMRKDAPVVDVGITKTGGTTPACKVPAYNFDVKVTNVRDGWPGTNNIVVTETVPANMTFGPISASGWTCPTGIIPAGTTFTCTYTGPAPTAGQGLPTIGIPATATAGPPFPPYVNSASVAITSSSGYVDSDPANNSATTAAVTKPSSCDCPPPQVMNAAGVCVPPPICQPPMALNAAGVCSCPPGTMQQGGRCVKIVIDCHQPMVPNAAGTSCVCPTGTVPQGGECVKPPACQPPMVPGPVAGQCICGPGYTLRGKECVKTLVCRPPLVANAAGTDCVCRGGLVRRGGSCVQPVVCRSPAKLNGAGTGCDCPANMTKKGNSCVEREKPRVRTEDVIRGIRGIGGGGGGVRDNGGGPTRGGGASPGKN